MKTVIQSNQDLIKLRDRLKRDLDAVERVLEISRLEDGTGIGTLVMAAKKTQPVKSMRGEYGAVGKAISQALDLCSGEFSYSDVENGLATIKQPLRQEQISLAINRMIKQKKIAVSKPRHGRTPAIYKKI